MAIKPGWFGALLSAGLLLGPLAAVAGSIPGFDPIATVQIDGQTWTIDSSHWQVDPETGEFSLDPVTFSNAEGQITLSGGGLADPVQAYGANVLDFGAPSNFSFSLSVPIVLPNPSGIVSITGDISGSFADGAPLGAEDGGSVTQIGGTLGIAEWDVNGVYLLGNGASYTYLPPNRTQSYPIPPQATLLFDCSTTGSGTCDSFSTRISFTGGGGGDDYGFSTSGTINLVPEPLTALLLSSGLMGLAIYRRKRTR